jgi:hypothetical protein
VLPRWLLELSLDRSDRIDAHRAGSTLYRSSVLGSSNNADWRSCRRIHSAPTASSRWVSRSALQSLPFGLRPASPANRTSASRRLSKCLGIAGRPIRAANHAQIVVGDEGIESFATRPRVNKTIVGVDSVRANPEVAVRAPFELGIWCSATPVFVKRAEEGVRRRADQLTQHRHVVRAEVDQATDEGRDVTIFLDNTVDCLG